MYSHRQIRFQENYTLKIPLKLIALRKFIANYLTVFFCVIAFLIYVSFEFIYCVRSRRCFTVVKADKTSHMKPEMLTPENFS